MDGLLLLLLLLLSSSVGYGIRCNDVPIKVEEDDTNRQSATEMIMISTMKECHGDALSIVGRDCWKSQ